MFTLDAWIAQWFERLTYDHRVVGVNPPVFISVENVATYLTPKRPRPPSSDGYLVNVKLIVRLTRCRMSNSPQVVRWLMVCLHNTREVIAKSGEQRLLIGA